MTSEPRTTRETSVAEIIFDDFVLWNLRMQVQAIYTRSTSYINNTGVLTRQIQTGGEVPDGPCSTHLSY